MANREFVMLSQTLTDKHRAKVTLSEWFVSTKLDGMRAIWIPHTAGKSVGEIPFANRERDSRDHVATGLWSRYAKVIHAPKWFTQALPTDQCLDGELWAGRQKFNQLVSATKKLEPIDSEWDGVRFMIFDSPSYEMLFSNGRVNGVNYKMIFKDFAHPGTGDIFPRFEETYWRLRREVRAANVTHVEVLDQFKVRDWNELYEHLDNEVSIGGEGLMLRRIGSTWMPKRSHDLLKVKPHSDAEGTVVGWTPGVGKYEGMMGSLKIRMDNGNEFDLSGFTDEERTLAAPSGHVNMKMTEPLFFRHGERITYKYRELTPDGKPREARYHRKRED